MLLYDATLFPPVETLALDILQVAVLFFVVLTVKYIHTMRIVG